MAKETSKISIIKRLINNNKIDNNTSIAFFININYSIINLITNKTSNIKLIF